MVTPYSLSALYTGRISMGRSLFHHLASESMTIGDNEVHVCIFFSLFWETIKVDKQMVTDLTKEN